MVKAKLPYFFALSAEARHPGHPLFHPHAVETVHVVDQDTFLRAADNAGVFEGSQQLGRGGDVNAQHISNLLNRDLAWDKATAVIGNVAGIAEFLQPHGQAAGSRGVACSRQAVRHLGKVDVAAVHELVKDLGVFLGNFIQLSLREYEQDGVFGGNMACLVFAD